MMLTLWAATCAPKAWRGALVLIFMTMQACLKENIFVTLAILGGWIAYEGILRLFIVNKASDAETNETQTMAQKIYLHVKEHVLEMFVGALVSAFIFYYLFSEGFRYPAGPTDFFTKSFSYWLDQHNKERIRGVFNFHLYTLSWYETPLVVATIYAWMRFVRCASLYTKAIAGYFVLAALFCALYTAGSNIESQVPWTYINLKDSLDVFFAVALIGHSVLIPTWHLLRNERTLAFFSYFFLATLFTYSYLGEKVPWLTVYPLIAGIPYLALLYSKHETFFAKNVSVECVLRWLAVSVQIFAVIVLLTEGGISAEPFGLVKLGIILLVAALSLCAFLEIPGFKWLRITNLTVRSESGSGDEIRYLLITWIILLGVAWIWATQSSVADSATNANEIMNLVKFNFAISFGLAVLSLLPTLGGPGFGALRATALVAVPFCVWSLRSAILTNFTYAGHAREFMSQVHTTPEFNRFVLKVRDDIEAPVSGVKPTVCASGEMTWPITWYFVGVSEYMFPTGSNQAACDAANYRLVDKDFADKNPTPKGYLRQDIPLRGWWVPDIARMTPRAFLNYSLNHTPFSETGFSWTTAYIKQPP